MKHYKMMPWELDKLTIPELVVLFEALQDKKPETDTAKAIEFSKAWAKLSPLEELDAAIKQYCR